MIDIPPQWVIDLTVEIVTAYPEVDQDRARYIRNKLRPVGEKAAREAWNQYLQHGNDELFKLGRLLAIANRIAQQEAEKQDGERRSRQAVDERSESERIARLYARGDQIIADMSDDEVLEEWQPILQGMKGKIREWAEKWTPRQIRTNRQFRLRMAELFPA
jgi:hypothetical protein